MNNLRLHIYLTVSIPTVYRMWQQKTFDNIKHKIFEACNKSCADFANII